PEFIEGLVDIAQRGRSLGIHLVLATQHPRGVVTEALRANVGARIALRTADPDGSIDVVDTPEAAALPRSAPGRAIVRSGPSTTVTIHTAWTGGSAAPPPRVRVHPIGRRSEHGGSTVTELEAAVRVVSAAHDGRPSPRRPWCDPLPTHLPLASLAPSTAGGQVSVGLIDQPDLQQQAPLIVNLNHDGGVAVIGAPGSGRTTALRTLITTFATHPSEVVHIDVIDADGQLRDVAALSRVGAVVDVDDTERVLRLLRRTAARTGAPLGASGCAPRHILVIDGIATFEQRLERLHGGVALDLLQRIALSGPSAQVHLAVSARRLPEIPPSLGTALRARLLLRPASVEDATLADLPEIAANAGWPAGRCHLRGEVAQIAVHRADHPHQTLPHPAPPLDLLPASDRRPVAAQASTPWRIPVGIHADTLELVHLDLTADHAVVLGTGRSGVSSTLAALATRVDAATALVTDYPPSDHRFDAVVAPTMVTELRSLVDAAAGRLLICVDDADRCLDGSALDDALEEWLTPPAPLRSVRVVLGGDVDAMCRSLAASWGIVRRAQRGVLLRVDPDLHSHVLRTALPRRDELPPRPGLGWCIEPDAAIPVQLLLPPPSTSAQRTS
ncbi:MAG: FtsK/SpoIIIE domain-containing protein, partial [Actinomycetes bacterium]